MKKLILTAILTVILPVFLASAENNDNGNQPGGKQKQCEGGNGQGKCNGKNGNGKPKKKGKPAPGAAANVQ